MGILIGTIALLAATKARGEPKQAHVAPYRVLSTRSITLRAWLLKRDTERRGSNMDEMEDMLNV